MDSGNSGSMQSSSGGGGGGGDDQEFHSSSRGSESISSFFNNNTSTFSTHHHQPQHNQPQFFPQNFFQSPFQQQPNNPTTAHYNDIWSNTGLIRSDHHQPTYTNFPNLSTPSSSIPPITTATTTTPRPSTGPTTAVPEAHTSRSASDQLSHVIKNPKKRTRASRRAPTTVLNTDTTNFRQMVQEFTGIPAVPFSGSTYSRRLDLFSAASGLRPGPNVDTLGPMYPLRPAAHKINIPSQFSLNSSMLDSTSVPNNSPNIDQLLNLHHQHQQQHHQQQQNVSTSLLQGFGNQLSGFTETNRGEQVRNQSGNEESLMRFNHVNVNSSASGGGGGGESVQVQDQQQQQNMISSGSGGYNRNNSTTINLGNNSISEKGSLDNNSSDPHHQGNVASWICPSD